MVDLANMIFEEIDSVMDRAKVFGGWIVRCESRNYISESDESYTYSYSICFVPDPKHAWKLNLDN